jgi:hypothetical protein
MSNTSPGPWTLHPEADRIESGDLLPIAFLSRIECARFPGNLHVMGAALDLLAACKEARFRLFGTEPSNAPLCSRLDAAIAKAEAV